MNTKKDYFPSGNEDLKRAYLWATIFVLVIATSLTLASREYVVVFQTQIRALYFWELIAIGTTVFLTGVYFADMLRLSHDASLERRSEQLWIGLLNGFSFFIITIAAICLIIHAFSKTGNFLYFIYLALLAISFIMFAVMDYLAAKILIGYRKTREYWALCFFNDTPTAIAFILLLIYSSLYYVDTKSPPNVDVIGGAVAMQMLINSTIYLGVISNFVFKAFRHYCGDNIERD